MTAADGAGAAHYREQLAAVLAAVEARPPWELLWFGRQVATPPRSVRARTGERFARELLVHRLEARLYADFYSAGAPRLLRGGPATAVTGSRTEFVRALSQANCGRGCWQGGWRILAADSDSDSTSDSDSDSASDSDSDSPSMLVARADGLQLRAPAARCRAEAPGGAGGGAHARVLVPKELLAFSPGFYVAAGDAGPAPQAGEQLVRISWNIAAAGAITLVKRVTFALNQAGMPFSLEVLDNPGRFGRCDAAVLRVGKGDVEAAIKLARPVVRVLAPHLTDRPPAMTKPLARGLAVAEDPHTGESFGEHRCRLLAEAIVAAGERGLRTIAPRLEVVRDHFSAAGLSLEAPYLAPGSDDVYTPLSV